MLDEGPDELGDHRCAAHAAADPDLPADLAFGVHDGLQPDIVEFDRGAVGRRCRHREFELARQVRELRVKARPLAKDFGHGPRIEKFVRGGARELVGRDIADAIARSLDRVHLHFIEVLDHVGHIAQPRPVELDVGAGGEVAVAAVIGTRDVGELAQLPGPQRPVGDRNAEHIGVQLQIEPVHQPQRPELVLVDLAAYAPHHLVAELRGTLLHERRVELVISIHDRPGPDAGDRSAEPSAPRRVSVRGCGRGRSPHHAASRSRSPMN